FPEPSTIRRAGDTSSRQSLPVSASSQGADPRSGPGLPSTGPLFLGGRNSESSPLRHRARASAALGSVAMRSVLPAAFGLLLLCSIGSAAIAAGGPSPVRLVVVVSVDGLSWPRLDGYRGWYGGGLARLLDSAQVETACNYQHLNTETGPGHASLATGAPPSV